MLYLTEASITTTNDGTARFMNYNFFKKRIKIVKYIFYTLCKILSLKINSCRFCNLDRIERKESILITVTDDAKIYVGKLKSFSVV